jgi:hypothetical protein
VSGKKQVTKYHVVQSKQRSRREMNNFFLNLRQNGKVCLICDAIYLASALTLPIALPFIIISLAIQ